MVFHVFSWSWIVVYHKTQKLPEFLGLVQFWDGWRARWILGWMDRGMYFGCANFGCFTKRGQEVSVPWLCGLIVLCSYMIQHKHDRKIKYLNCLHRGHSLNYQQFNQCVTVPSFFSMCGHWIVDTATLAAAIGTPLGLPGPPWHPLSVGLNSRDTFFWRQAELSSTSPEASSGTSTAQQAAQGHETIMNHPTLTWKPGIKHSILCIYNYIYIFKYVKGCYCWPQITQGLALPLTRTGGGISSQTS